MSIAVSSSSQYSRPVKPNLTNNLRPQRPRIAIKHPSPDTTRMLEGLVEEINLARDRDRIQLSARIELADLSGLVVSVAHDHKRSALGHVEDVRLVLDRGLGGRKGGVDLDFVVGEEFFVVWVGVRLSGRFKWWDIYSFLDRGDGRAYRSSCRSRRHTRRWHHRGPGRRDGSWDWLCWWLVGCQGERWRDSREEWLCRSI